MPEQTLTPVRHDNAPTTAVSTSDGDAPVSPAPPVGVATMPTPARRRTPAPAHQAGYDGPDDFPTMWLMAQSLASATILPEHFHKEPGNVFAVMTQARAANLPVFVALQHMNVIDGRVEESAELVRAMLIRAGYTIGYPRSSDTVCVIHVCGPGLPDGGVDVSFTLAEAQLMNLTHKKNWKASAASMLVARATTRFASRYAPHVTMGLANLSHAELGDAVPEALAHLREPDPEEVAARHVWFTAQQATTVDAVRVIGSAARRDDLLGVNLDGLSLELRLLACIDALQASAQITSDEVGKQEPGTGELLECGCGADEVLATGEHAADCRG